jgi:hypothetical protein
MQHPEAALLSHLQALEVELHQPAVRADAARLDALIHDDFQEFGRSGATYDKTEILARLLSAEDHTRVVADNFALRRLAADVALLTYRSAHRQPDGTLHRFTLRCSVWQRTNADFGHRDHPSRSIVITGFAHRDQTGPRGMSAV